MSVSKYRYHFLFTVLRDHNWPCFLSWRCLCIYNGSHTIYGNSGMVHCSVFIISVVTVTSNIVVMCIWLKPGIRSHVTILLAALSLSDSIAVSLPGICLPIALYSNIPENETVYVLCYVISKYIPLIFHSFSNLVTTIVAIQRLCICAFPFKHDFYSP
jgi:hypothetical protein